MAERKRRIDRREFLARVSGAAAAFALAPQIVTKRRERTLRILQWSHFVPSYDAWFDQFAKDWGAAHEVDVTVDHIALADLVTRANAEVAAQQGHDLFQFLSPPGGFEPQLLDMGDLVREAERQHGPLIDLCKRSTYNPVTRKWFGFSDNYVPDPGDYLKSVWTEIGMPDGPVTWEDLVKAGPLIKGKHPEIQIPIGVGMSQELDTNMATRAMLWSHDGSIQDANENVVLKSDQALEALNFAARLFQAGMNPAVLSWNAASNNQALNAKQTAYILNSISAYRTAQDNKLPVAGNKWLEQVTANDPFGSNPPTKLKPISTALKWATNIGHPGPANPAESEIFDTFVLPTMFANAATGRMSPKQALDEAHEQAKKIFEKWRGKGLVAGGSGDH